MNLLDQRMANVSGEIHFSGEDLLKKSEKELCNIRGKGISMIFQDPMTSLNPILTIGEQIREVLKLHAEPGTSKQQIEDRVDEVLELVSIPKSRKKDYPHQFSGGMQQRAALARTLMRDAQLILMDEPFAALDSFTRETMQKELLRIRREKGCGVILVTHNIDEALILGDRIVLLSGGQAARSYELPEQDGCRDILTEPFLSIKKSVIEAMKSL